MRRKKIAISQRRDQIDRRNEVRDALDVRVGQFLWDLGFNPIPLASQISDPKSYYGLFKGMPHELHQL